MVAYLSVQFGKRFEIISDCKFEYISIKSLKMIITLYWIRSNKSIPKYNFNGMLYMDQFQNISFKSLLMQFIVMIGS